MRIDPSDFSKSHHETPHETEAPFGVPGAVKSLHEAHARLDMQVGRIIDRLGSVLMPGEALVVAVESAMTKREPSPLTQEIESAARFATSVVDRLAEALDRLEL